MLEKTPRKSTKLITGFRDLSYEEILKECGLTTLEMEIEVGSEGYVDKTTHYITVYGQLFATNYIGMTIDFVHPHVICTQDPARGACCLADPSPPHLFILLI